MQDEIKRLLFSAEPWPDESFTGYLLRLAQMNDFDTLSWILQMARLRDYANQSPSYSLDPSLDLSPLACLSGVEESKLAALQYRPVRVSTNRMMGDYSVFGSSLPHYLIRLERPKICTGCLRENVYARRIWDLAPVTACPLHKCLLLDECPSCKKRINWNRPGVSVCRCKFDWREHKTDLMDDSMLLVARQVYLLCHLPVGPSRRDESRDNPLYKLGLRQFITALIFIASQFMGIAMRKGQRTIDTKGKHFVPSRRNTEIHDLLCKALLVFNDWPDNYYSFLDMRRSQKAGDDPTTVSSNYFEEYKSALFVQLASTDFEFMRSAFREYRRIRRYESYVTSSDNMVTIDEKGEMKSDSPTKADDISLPVYPDFEISRLHETHVSGKKAIKALKTTWPGLHGLIASGRLKAIIGSKGENRLFLVEKASLDELKEKLERSLFLKQVERLLGIHRARIKELIECGLLTPLRGPEVDGCGDWRFDQREVAGLVDRLVSALPRKRGADKRKVLSFQLVLRKIGRANIGLGVFLQAVLDGEIKPCGGSKKAGLGGLLFWKDQVTDYVQSEFRLLIGDALSSPEVAKLLGVTKNAVSFLVKKGLLHAEKFASAPSLGLLVKREEFDSFNETYLLAREAASKHGTSPNYIIDLLNQQDVQPISGPKVDGGHIYLLKKSEVKALDLAFLISEKKKKRGIAWKPSSERRPTSKGSRQTSGSKPNRIAPKASQWWILDESQAANVLELNMQAVRELAERGALKQHKRLSPDKQREGKYYFSSYTIQKYKGRSADYIGLTSFLAAAKMLNLYPDNFYNRYVKTGRLNPVLAEGRRCEHFFRLKDVEALLEIERQTIITPEAAKILKVNVSCIDKMIASRVLYPISGPGIDGFGKNLFLRSDVEKLYAERGLQSKEHKEGKTSRFGRGI